MQTPIIANTFLAFTALTLHAADKPRLDPSIVKSAETYRTAMLAGDAAAVRSTYTDDAVVMPSCQPAVKGKAAIERYYREFFAGPVKLTAFTFSYMEALPSGDTGYAAGTYVRKLSVPSGQIVEDTGKFVAIVKHTAEGWKAAYVIHNSDHPEAAPPTPPTALVLPYRSPVLSYLASLFH